MTFVHPDWRRFAQHAEAGFLHALDPRGADVVQAMLERGFLVNNTSATTVRFLPPLVITGDELAKALAALRDVLSA